CGACMNHCPVYGALGGHAYGWVYPGPMGSVLTPLFLGLDKAKDLPNACTLNGRCQSVCPVGIPLPELLRDLREDQYRLGMMDKRWRWGLKLWAWGARRPSLYHAMARLKARLLARFARKRGYFRHLPTSRGWTDYRDLPAPQGDTFQSLWQKRKRS
ncbi:MAG: lactate utilization protein, partial [Chromatiales bacterium]|nr:lactate utilization protein [Chromatiales bacterium]